MTKIKKIKMLAYAKMQAVIMDLSVWLQVAIFSIGLIYDVFTNALSFGTVMAFGAILGMPVIFAVFGYITGIIGVFLYNIFSKWFGDMKIDIVL